MKLSILLAVLSLSVFAFAEPQVFSTWGNRQTGDRLLGSYHQKQGPFEDARELDFYFEHFLNGNIFTASTLTGKSLFVRIKRIS
jgi:hypothetical protein